MADSKLSELSYVTGLTSSDLVYVVQGATSKKISASSLTASILSGNLSNTSKATLLLGNTDVNGPNSAELTIDKANDYTGLYMDKTVVQIYTSSYVQLITNTLGAGYIWNFNADGTTTLPFNAYVPTTSGSIGAIGQVSWTSSYVYVCVATNTWKRATLNSW
jgi:hypothetical protein